MRPFHSCSLLALIAFIAVPAWGLQPAEKSSSEPKQTETSPWHLVVHWSDTVAFLPDPLRDGMPRPCLTGRVYLIGPWLHSQVKTDSDLVVQLFNLAEREPDGRPRLIEKWILSSKHLQKLERPAFLGCGYNLFLPWGSYRPDMAQILLWTSYQSEKGPLLYSDSGPIRLKRCEGGHNDVRGVRVLEAGMTPAPSTTRHGLVSELIAILNETKSADTFLVTLRLLEGVGPPAEPAIPAVLRNAERLGLFQDNLMAREDRSELVERVARSLQRICCKETTEPDPFAAIGSALGAMTGGPPTAVPPFLKIGPAPLRAPVEKKTEEPSR